MAEHPSRRMHVYPTPPRQYFDSYPLEKVTFDAHVAAGHFAAAFGYARDSGFRVRLTDVAEESREAFKAWLGESVNARNEDSTLDHSAGAWR